jgi:O-antigen/teichoic acid export membrane protein
MSADGRNVESHGRMVFRHSLMTFGTRMSIVLVNIPTSILIARLLGTDGQGTYASAVIFPTMFAFIGLLGIDSAHTYLLSRRRYPLSQINSQSLILTLVFSAIIAPIYLVFLKYYDGASDPSLHAILAMGVFLIPILLAKYFAIALFLGLQRIRWFNAANFIQAAALLGFMCVNLFVVKGGAMGALTAYMGSEVLVVAIGVGAVVRSSRGGHLDGEAGNGELPGAILSMPSLGLLRKSLIYGIQGHVGNILTQFTYRFDMFLVLSMVGLKGQGLYSISVLMAEKLSHIPQSVQVVLFPKLSSMEVEEANELTPRVMRSSLLLTALAGVILYLLSRPLLVLFYSTEFVPALNAFRILIPGIVTLSIAKILSSDFSGRDRRIFQTIATAIAFAVNVVLCFVWIPRYGIEGAAWASTAAYTLQSGIMIVFFRKLSGRGVFESLVVRGEDFALYGRTLRRLVTRGD